MTARRRRLALSSVPVAVALLLVAASLIGLSVFMRLGAAAVERGDAAGAGRAFGPLTVLGVVEPWKAPFARGDADVVGLDPDAARLEFERALDLAPRTSACVVRANLVLTIEQLVERATDTTASTDLIGEALAVAAASDSVPCPRRARVLLDDAEKRLREKLAAAALPQLPGTAPTSAPAGEPQEASQDQLDALADQQAQSAAARADATDRQQTWDQGGGNQSDTPW